ncbi:hypothetical protein [Bradyrhizobium sp. CCGB01]|uniref:hypothetical protein n=1 Tax=Bradyrhizobium sp. CCGB01 TaxID=2949634 RepID=UPI0020B40965|nr:hypothetical protein [Bradyrhizobium sp. CCGB01]MCP3405627.1 hypothetical protein [Bradyrhizobium sp. CCGB01]
MSPLEAVTRWLESQDLDMQLEIAGFATFLTYGNEGVLALGGSEQLESLHRWLNESNLASCIAADRALSFRTFFDCFVAERMTDVGWKRTEELMRKRLKEAKRDGKSAAARKAQRMLELLPARKESWRRVVKSWNELAGTNLTREAVSSWFAAERRIGLRVISSGVPVVAPRWSQPGTG